MREITIESINAKFPTGYRIEKELLLYDQKIGLPTITEAGKLKCIILAFCTQGEISYTINTVAHKVGSGDVLIANAGEVIGNYRASADCSGACLAMSPDFFQEVVSGFRELSALFLFAKRYPVFHITDRQISQLEGYFMKIKEKVIDLEHRFRRELVTTLIKVLIYDTCNTIYAKQEVEKVNGTRAETIFAEFIRLVEKHFRRERRVSSYAAKLCLTPKYLSETVKAVSQRSPSEWIEYYVMMEIRVLLKNSRMSIKEIADALNFPNQSFLGKYFKEHYGMSPTQYRRS